MHFCYKNSHFEAFLEYFRSKNVCFTGDFILKNLKSLLCLKIQYFEAIGVHQVGMRVILRTEIMLRNIKS